MRYRFWHSHTIKPILIMLMWPDYCLFASILLDNKLIRTLCECMCVGITTIFELMYVCIVATQDERSKKEEECAYTNATDYSNWMYVEIFRIITMKCYCNTHTHVYAWSIITSYVCEHILLDKHILTWRFSTHIQIISIYWYFIWVLCIVKLFLFFWEYTKYWVSNLKRDWIFSKELY